MKPSQLKNFNSEPTLTDTEVLEFCKNGYLMFERIVPNDVNLMTMNYCDQHSNHEPSDILNQDWFIEKVIINPPVAGAVRSLLGANFHLPVLMSNHRVHCPQGADSWHVDGNHQIGTELNYLQVFYYPQDTPIEMGPTQILPGSHLIHNKATFMGHLSGIRGTIPTAAPAGSIFVTIYNIWHRRGPSTATGTRNLLKYFYWRTTSPKRDWVIEPGFDFSTAAYYGGPSRTYVEPFRDAIKIAEMFLWLCGKHRAFQNLGGQSWPLPANRIDFPYGLHAALQ